MARKCLVSVYPTCPLLFTQKPTLRPLSWAVPDHTPPAHPVCPTFPFLYAPLSTRHSFSLSIPERCILHLRVSSVYLPSLYHLRATCINAMSIYEKLYCVLCPLEFQTKTVYLFLYIPCVLHLVLISSFFILSLL
jgi:hypothetical protein